MNKKIKKQLIPFLPPMIFFLLAYAASKLLYKYNFHGPIRDGVPVFKGHYVQVVSTSFDVLLVLSFLGSVYLIYRNWKDYGVEKFLISLVILLLLPIKYLSLMYLSMHLWGK